MSSIDYINRLAARGIQLWAEDGKLRYKAPAEAMTPEVLTELKDGKTVLVALLEQFAGTAGSYPLSYSQKSLWSLHQLNPDSTAYNVTYATRLADSVDLPVLARCVDYLIARHPILRTTYGVVDGEPRQRVSIEASARLVVDTVTDADAAAIDRWIDDVANRPFDLEQSPIRLRLLVNASRAADSGAPACVLLLNVHHIAADFWSLEIFIDELRRLYEMAQAGEALKLPPVVLQYKDYVEHEASQLQGEGAAALAAFWANELRDGAPLLDLATDRVRPPLKTENGRVHALPLGEVLTEQVRATARSLRVTPYMLLLSVYQMFLFLQTGQRRVHVGAPTAGRGMPGSESVMGHFVNTVVLACEIDPDASFAELAAATRERMARVLDHQDQPFPLLVEQLRPPRDPSRSPLFQVMYNWNQQRSGAMAKAGGGAALFGDLLKASSTGTRGATHDLTLNIQDYGDEYRTAWTFNTDLFDEETIGTWALQFATLAGQCLTSPQRPTRAFSLAADADKARVTARLEAVAHLGITALAGAGIGAVAASDPARLAWQLDAHVVTYGELVDAIGDLHGRLSAQGVRAGMRVGVQLASLGERALALLALLRLGASGVSCGDDEVPQAEDRGAFACFVEGGSVAGAGWAPEAIRITASHDDARAAIGSDTGDDARRIGGFITTIGAEMNVSADTRAVLLAGTEDRLAMAILIAVAGAGGAVRVPGDTCIAELAGDARAEAGRTVGAHVAAFGATAMALPALLVPLLPDADGAPLRCLLAYGDHPYTIAALRARQSDVPSASVALRFVPSASLNGWQPPAVFEPEGRGQAWRLRESDDDGAVPAVLGPNGALAARRQRGKLHWLMPQCEAAGRPADWHEDLASWRSKIRAVATPITLTRCMDALVCRDPSLRVAEHGAVPVELGVVEQCVARVPGVREVACHVQEIEGRLGHVAYIATDPAWEDAVGDGVQDALRRLLPDIMHPDHVVRVPRLPLDERGALKTSCLPVPAGVETQARAARDAVERTLAEIWCDVLSLPSVNIDDDFFELGGDSILAAVIVSKASLQGIYLKPKDVFECGTIARLARAASATPLVAAEQGPIDGDAVLGPASAWFFHHIDVDRSHFNQALLLSMRERPDETAMREALRRVARQHDVLRSRFIRGDDGWRQVFDGRDDEVASSAWSVVSCVGPDGRLCDDTRDNAIHASQTSLDIEQGTLWRVVWLAGPTLAESRLLIVVHHLLIDGISWSPLLQDISDGYQGARAGKELAPLLKTTSVKAWVGQWQHALGSAELDADREYWNGFAGRLYEAMHGDRAGAVALMRHGDPVSKLRVCNQASGIFSIALDEVTTEAFRTTAHQAYGTDADDMLLAALHAAFHAWSGSSAMLVDLEGHGRAALGEAVDLSRTMGWFTSIHPVFLEAGTITDPGRLIRYVKERLRETPRKGASFGPLRYLTDPAADATAQALAALPPSPVLLTYLGQLDQMTATASLFGPGLEPAPGIRSSRQPRTHLLDLCAFIARGRLTIECTFHNAPGVEEGMTALMAHFKANLVAMVEHCCGDDAGGLTPSDVPGLDLGQDELDALLEEVAALER
ncbi:condensation domain-containing protein [Cupriavidus consociatus]|uniref:condensation domain-containing protein n=1 Tax=Cupriavidus consociatus TaxID=2821357 RepID=UPI001AE48F92|nr:MULTISPECIES: condensation domain-containing protein [unclassified Cupriavidus]MBP0624105.1 hypothetical protein [Cupriavidus sp. LEh25]MDK2660815.1 condensation domain-containing protein [Cupriavidus sp. LEh21]